MERREYKPRTPRLRTPAEALESLRDTCARSEKCCFDLRRTLRRWAISPEDSERIMASLIADRFVDDARYAPAFVRDKMRFSKWGSHKIAAALRAKGISKEIIEESLSQLEPESMKDKLLENIRRKCARTKARDRYDLRDKLIRYGASQGYDFSDVLDAVREVIGSLDDPERE